MTLLLLVLMAFISSAIATNQTSDNQDNFIVATQEMQKANYFTFVMLINMAPHNIFQGGGITFLMPNDRTLSKTDMSESSVVDFLLRHSIPSPLLIDHLEHFPNGSMIPSSKPGFIFRVTNNGRRRIFLSNVRIISPNICTQGSNIRCHGIDGVAKPDIFPRPNIPTTTTSCSNSSTSPWAAAPSPPSSASTQPSVVEFSGPKSGSPQIIDHGGVFDLVMIFFMVGVVELLWF
ncbi:hypothetical protein CASFOL_007029 [Castilleja foliolosa]|uniref:FAS1 domain-containing protein n=1 Tax=Castilleja foliolosa TaxID=1961234 RepID=A0ABD3E909_9LAMI